MATKTYKRTMWNMVKSLAIAPVTGVGVYFLLLWLLQFLQSNLLYWASFVLPVLLFVYLVYNAVWGSNIRFEIAEDGRCDYYKKNKLKNSFNLKNCALGYFKVSDANGSAQRLDLRIMDENGETHQLDCEPLGRKQFDEMYAQMQNFSEVEPEKLETL